MAPTPTYWLYGIHPVELALANPKRAVRRVIATRNAAPKLAGLLTASHPKAETLEPAAFEKILPAGVVHQGVALLVEPLPDISLEEILQNPETGNQKSNLSDIFPTSGFRFQTSAPLVLLDQVTDPHNVGAILRSAAAFNAACVIVTRRHAPEESGVIAKASAGGIELVPLIHVTNLAQAMDTIKKAGYWCAGLDGAAKQTMAEAKLSGKTALVMGAEGEGMRRLTAEKCDFLVRLPISAQMESLNVSNACAIALYELRRQ